MKATLRPPSIAEPSPTPYASADVCQPRSAMLIRSIVDADRPALRTLWRETWADTYGDVLGPERRHLVDDAVGEAGMAMMLPEDGRALGAFEGEEARGTICFAERASVARVWGMYVHPAHQRTGVGSALMRRALGSFVSAERVELSTSNPRALAFYRRLGFVDDGLGELEIFPDVRVPARSLRRGLRPAVRSSKGLTRAVLCTST